MSGVPVELPYRPNVGAVLFNAAGLVFVGRRAKRGEAASPTHVWQLPQGGIDDGEAPSVAVLRELREEIGTDRATILGEHDTWLTYDLPPDLVGSAFGGRYRGQRQRWFALRFDGDDGDIRLDGDGEPEFDAWRWIELVDLPELAVPFKRPVYEVIAEAFAVYAAHQPEPAAMPICNKGPI